MSDPAQLRFSVVVPAYNEEAFLADTLRSLRHQDYRGTYEILVVDNNSTDATAEIARSFGVRVVSEPEPGVCQARQRGLTEARGEIVVSVDADTLYPPDWLARIDASFRSRDRVVGVGGPCRYRDAPWWIGGFTTVLFGLVNLVYRASGWLGYVTATNTAFLKSAFDGYDLHLTQGGDELDLLRRLRKRGRMVWDRDNEVATSPRRQESGMLQTVFVSFLVFYLGAYFLNRIARRPVLGRAPVFRVEHGRRRRFRWGVGVGVAVLVTTTFGVARYLLGSS
ncbi:glycosyltransferase family 2 protein [Microlunatus ginsengisoli]|uniref:4,4'-diaponeurosporenoate glycosyltransferase n=1 Tax=Microlunatus ginsengisoli TaxID=363863 RepID=A0ABP7AJ10_9ACTN